VEDAFDTAQRCGPPVTGRSDYGSFPAPTTRSSWTQRTTTPGYARRSRCRTSAGRSIPSIRPSWSTTWQECSS